MDDQNQDPVHPDQTNPQPHNSPVQDIKPITEVALDLHADDTTLPTATDIPAVTTMKPDIEPLQPNESTPEPTPAAPNIIRGGFHQPVQDIKPDPFNEPTPPTSVMGPSIPPLQPPITPLPPVGNAPSDYQSNPFLTTISGLIQVLRYNPGSSMLSQVLIWVLTVIYVVFVIIVTLATKSPVASFIVIFIGYCLLIPLSLGLHFAVAAESINERTTTLAQVWRRTLGKFLPLIGLIIILSILTAIGFILLIIPGIIFVARSSLAPIIMFEEDLGPIKSVSRSLELTKGHTFEMIGVLYAASFIGGGALLAPAVSTAPLVGRYLDLRKLKASNDAKPKVHWLNYFVFILQFAIIAVLILSFFFLGKYGNNSPNPYSPPSNVNYTFPSSSTNSQ